LLTLSGCSAERQPATTEATQPSRKSETDERRWLGLEVENNDDVARTVTVVVELDGEQQFARTLSLRPQAEPEFGAVFPIPNSEPREVTVEADLEAGGSTRYSSTRSPGDDRRLYVTVGRNGAVVVGRYEPPESDSTTESA
jgi:hypothetical protein